MGSYEVFIPVDNIYKCKIIVRKETLLKYYFLYFKKHIKYRVKMIDKSVTCHLTFPVINFIVLIATVISLSKYRREFNCKLFSLLFSSPSNSPHSPLTIL